MSKISDAARQLVERHQAITEPSQFRLLNLDWDLLPGVYAPNLTQSAALYVEWLPYPRGGSFCEIGCGTGYISVLAALRGCAQVAALDVNPAAVDNARRNAKRHEVTDRMRVLQSDMFDALEPEACFDLIFWNSNFVAVDVSEIPTTDLDRAFFDPGYAAHRRFLAAAHKHLAPGGILLLGFTDLGDTAQLSELAKENGWEPSLIRGVHCNTDTGRIHYQLIRLDSIH